MKKIHVSGQYFLNHDLEPAELEYQIGEIAAAGYENIYAHSRAGMITPYLSNAWWRSIDTVVRGCREHDMRFSIWDEDYFPSCVAGDRIVWEHPELRGQSLVFSLRRADERDADGLFRWHGLALLGCYVLPLDATGKPTGEIRDVTADCGTVRQHWIPSFVQDEAYSKAGKIRAPHWRTSMDGKCMALQYRPDFPGDYLVLAVQLQYSDGVHNTDILNPETTRRFLEYTHDAYAGRLSAGLWDQVYSVFLDEPAPSSFFPWTGAFAREFEHDHGCALLPLLPHLALDIDAATPWVRHAFRRTQSRLQTTHYLGQVGDWCRQHGIRSVGHLTRTEYLYYCAGVWPEELRAYRELDIPCADPLGALVAWPDACAYHTGLKVVSSAAHIFGKEQAGTDALGVLGDETSLADLKFHLDYHMVMGITFFNLHGLSYSFAGPRKDEVPPPLFDQHPEWPWMSELTGYLRETADMLTAGEHLCAIGVLYPSAGIYCELNAANYEYQHPLELETHQFSEQLLSRQKDFDFIDETTLNECRNADGSVALPEAWQVLIVANAGYITDTTLDTLAALRQQGVRVIILGNAPTVLGTSPSTPQSPWRPVGESYPALTPELIASLPGPEVSSTDTANLLLLRRKLDNGTIRYFALNRAEAPFAGCVDGSELELPPRASRLWDGTLPAAPTSEVAAGLDCSREWRMSFEANQLPLPIWEAALGNADPAHLYYHPARLDLMHRQPSPWPEVPTESIYRSRFLYAGAVHDVRLFLDREALSGNWELRVNGVPVTDWEDCRIYDAHDRIAGIAGLIRTNGAMPAENQIEIRCRNGELRQMPRLFGAFQAEFRQAVHSLPFLRGCDRTLELPQLLPWLELGFPAYAGCAVYRREVTLAADGNYELDLGRVCDLAEVHWDGRKIGVCAWTPYRIALGRQNAGAHRLELRVAAAPGNRERLAALASGLIGPVTLHQLR